MLTDGLGLSLFGILKAAAMQRIFGGAFPFIRVAGRKLLASGVGP